MDAALTAVIAFVATDVDDLLLLVYFFGQRAPRLPVWQVVLGQYLGFSALVVLSLLALLGQLLVPLDWLRWCGLLPLALGLWQVLSGWNGAAPDTDTPRELASGSGVVKGSVLLGVAAVTFANGGDNLGLYIPLFATSSPASVAIMLLCFTVMVGVWCGLAWQLTRQPALAAWLAVRGQRLLPWVLLLLGLKIVLLPG